MTAYALICLASLIMCNRYIKRGQANAFLSTLYLLIAIASFVLMVGAL